MPNNEAQYQGRDMDLSNKISGSTDRYYSAYGEVIECLLGDVRDSSAR